MKKQRYLTGLVAVLAILLIGSLIFTGCPTGEESPPAIPVDLGNQTVAITAPVTGNLPQTGIVGTTGFTGVVGWKKIDGGNVTDHDGIFQELTVYRAVIPLTSADGFQWPAYAPLVTVAGGYSVDGTRGTVSGTGSGNILTFSVTFTQTGGLPRYTVTVNYGSGGGDYAAGQPVTVTASPPEGHDFTGWTISDTEPSHGSILAADTNFDPGVSPTFFIMKAELDGITLTAEFEPVYYTIVFFTSIVDTDTTGTNITDIALPTVTVNTIPIDVTDNAAMKANFNDDVRISLKPIEGVRIEHIIIMLGDDEFDSSAHDTIEFKMPSGDIIVEVHYDQIPEGLGSLGMFVNVDADFAGLEDFSLDNAADSIKITLEHFEDAAVEWYVDGDLIDTVTVGVITIKAEDYGGRHTLSVIVTKDGSVYSKSVTFTVGR